MTWGHDVLADDLARHLQADGEYWTWCNIQYPSENCRPDVLAFKRWAYHAPALIAYEVKVDRGDLRGDLTSGKWQKYLSEAQGLTFAVPIELGVKPAEVPDGCGLIVRSARGWAHRRRPTLQASTISQPMVAKLLSCRPNIMVQRGHSERGGEESWEVRQTRQRSEAAAMRAVGKRYGEKLARLLADPRGGQGVIDEAQKKAQEIRDEAAAERGLIKEAWAELGKLVGLDDDDLNRWRIPAAVKAVVERLESESALIASQRAALRTIVREAGKVLLPEVVE